MDRQFLLADNSTGTEAFFVAEPECYEGVRRIAGKVMDDVERVSGVAPKLLSPEEASVCGARSVVLCATVGHSGLIARLSEEGKFDLSGIEGKWEVYKTALVEHPFENVDQALVICGSDKRGTIYGMFALSEYIGVSPLWYWGDVMPVHRDRLVVGADFETVSREPGVRYRGFFINDEWPCFGNWACSHFDGFTAEMYDHVFELLLRLKGNYLWPAMWTSSFPLDGPGSLNEELADLYGVVIGFSHHEPCLRASEEWDKVRGEDSPYGNEWNYATNGEGLARYWEDGLKRSGKYEHIVTIGMRGERDSSMLGEGATLKDNIDLLREIILKQRELIGRQINPDVDSVPQLLALYKEVEAYFYGDEQTEGLRDWKELEHVIFMLCEDNFGHMRTLPTKELRGHAGGFGMYYHLDYHGGPVSYEWMPSTPLSLIWEQMTQAYEYGVQDVWIVNVGDLKGNEIALSYFLALAYDYERWGRLWEADKPGWMCYLQEWAAQNFPAEDASTQRQIAGLYRDLVKANSMRRPETVKEETYHPCHYREGERILAAADGVLHRSAQLFETLAEASRDAYYSMIAYPAEASMNLLRMQLCAGRNHHYARQGRAVANSYGDLARECIHRDRQIAEKFGAFLDGKWKGMELEKHIGFTRWNDDGWRYPVMMEVTPVDAPRLSVSRADEEWIHVKNYGSPGLIRVDDFQCEAVDCVELELSNDGRGTLVYRVEPEGQTNIPEWLNVTPSAGEIGSGELERLCLICDRSRLPREPERVRLIVSDGDTSVAVEVTGGWSRQRKLTEEKRTLPPKTHFGRDGVIVMEAEHYSSRAEEAGAAYEVIPDYGRSGSGVKVLPSTCSFGEKGPTVTYAFEIPQTGEYRTELWFAPGNALVSGQKVRVMLSGSGFLAQELVVLDEQYRGGELKDGDWCGSVLDQIRKRSAVLHYEAGVQTLTVEAREPGVVLERILIFPADRRLPASYLGPEGSGYL